MNNIVSGNLGITVGSGMIETDPQLVKNSHNYYQLASNNYPTLMDIANLDDDPTICAMKMDNKDKAQKILVLMSFQVQKGNCNLYNFLM